MNSRRTPPKKHDEHPIGPVVEPAGAELSAGEVASGPNENPHFDIDASVVFQLGEHLISDVVQALIELVKNAYDADASYAKITVETNAPPPAGSRFPESKGYVLVEDDGHGMNWDAIVDGWLVIAASEKRDQKRRRETTPGKQRTPLGDKGLGRLGVQRLGRNVEITTRYTPPGDTPSEEHVVAFSWDSFVGARRLSQVPVTVQKVYPPSRDKGTRVLISDLKDPETWRGVDAVDRLRNGLSQLISPYHAIQGFRVHATLNGSRADLAELNEALRRTAQIHYDLVHERGELSVTGRARLAYFRPPSGGKMRDRFRSLVESDNGNSFLDFLTARKDAPDFHLARARSPDWFVEFSQKFPLATLGDKALLPDGTLADPGPFHGEVDGFNLSAESAREALETVRHVLGSNTFGLADAQSTEERLPHIFDSTSELNKHIKRLSGIRVYRDGFGVRVDYDWLGLASERTSGKSYYSLRPANTLGYIAITARDNAQLSEKTDREGFQVTPYYKNFFLLLKAFTKFSNDVQAFLRRSWLRFEEESRRGTPTQVPAVTPDEIARQMRDTLSLAETYREPIRRLSNQLVAASDAANQSLQGVTASASALGANGRLRTALDHHSTEVHFLANRIHETKTVLVELDGFLHTVAETNPLSAVLANEIADLHEQLAEVYSTISLGLTAEALSHELHNVADQLAARTQKALERLRRRPDADGVLITYAEYVRNAVGALRKQLSHLAPSLRYVRERREDISLLAFLESLSEFHIERMGQHNVRVAFEGDNQDFAIRMNRGKLTQVFDNLILNSEYWLREAIRSHEISHGMILLTVRSPFVRVADNGPGISQTVEHRLFTPFVTAKVLGEGRGLGLFITRQLLESEGCTIGLAPERNALGRLFVFEIDFSGALK